MCDTHDCCLSFETQQVPRSMYISSHLHKVYRRQRVKIAQNWPNMCLLFGIFWKIALWKSVNSEKVLKWLRILHIYRNSTKSRFSESSCKTRYTNTFASGILQDILKSRFIFNHRKSNLSSLCGLPNEPIESLVFTML